MLTLFPVMPLFGNGGRTFSARCTVLEYIRGRGLCSSWFHLENWKAVIRRQNAFYLTGLPTKANCMRCRRPSCCMPWPEKPRRSPYIEKKKFRTKLLNRPEDWCRGCANVTPVLKWCRRKLFLGPVLRHLCFMSWRWSFPELLLLISIVEQLRG